MSMVDMIVDVFADQIYGKIALKKLADRSGGLPENFRLYEAEWLCFDRQVMRITGAQYRVAKSGPNKGKLSIQIPKTKQTAYVTVVEMRNWQL